MFPQAHAFLPFVRDAHKGEGLDPSIDLDRQIVLMTMEGGIRKHRLLWALAFVPAQNHVPGAPLHTSHVVRDELVDATAEFLPFFGFPLLGVSDDVSNVPTDPSHGICRIIVLVDRETLLEGTAIVEVVEKSGYHPIERVANHHHNAAAVVDRFEAGVPGLDALGARKVIFVPALQHEPKNFLNFLRRLGGTGLLNHASDQGRTRLWDMQEPQFLFFVFVALSVVLRQRRFG